MSAHAELALLRKRVGIHLARIHEVRRTLEERAFYPTHDVRTESSAYTRTRRAMVEAEDQPCRICDVRYSTLRSRVKNPYGARAMETHHHVIEWAHANAVDVERFNRCVIGPLAERDPGKYARKLSRAEMMAWIDHDRDNLWVLCDVHHRHEWFGVHAISGPVWQAQRLMRAAVAEEIRERLSNSS